MSLLEDNPAKWFVSHEGQRYGPYPAQILSEWIAIGRIAKDAVVSDGGVWISVDEFMQQQAVAMRTNALTGPVPQGEPLADTAGPVAPLEEATENLEDALRSDGSVPDRDRIVILGRRRAGKTIY